MSNNVVGNGEGNNNVSLLLELVPFLKSKFNILSFPRKRESRFLTLDSGSRPE